MQNRRQKVFNRGLCVCARGLDIIKINKTPLIYSASYFNLRGLGALWRRDCRNGYANNFCRMIEQLHELKNSFFNIEVLKEFDNVSAGKRKTKSLLDFYT